MLLESPRFVKYPWTVTAILRNRAEEVEKGTALFSYSVKQLAPEYDADGVESMVEKTLVLRFESTTEGSIAQWRVQKGEVIERPGCVTKSAVIAYGARQLICSSQRLTSRH